MCRRQIRGEFQGVPINRELLKGTREDSETANVRVPFGFDTDDLRSTLYAAVIKSDQVAKSEAKLNHKMIEGIHFNVDEAFVTAEFMKKYEIKRRANSKAT